MYTPTHLKKWTMPQNYFGSEWPDYYVFLGRHRDSDLLTNSNFEVGLAKLGGETDTVLVVHEHHWAVGWVEWIAIHQDDEEALQKADQMKEDLDQYPVLDDEDLSKREYEACIDAIHNQLWWLEHQGKIANKAFSLMEDYRSFAMEIYNALPDSETEDRDGTGAYPSEEAVLEAWEKVFSEESTKLVEEA